MTIIIYNQIELFITHIYDCYSEFCMEFTKNEINHKSHINLIGN